MEKRAIFELVSEFIDKATEEERKTGIEKIERNSRLERNKKALGFCQLPVKSL